MMGFPKHEIIEELMYLGVQEYGAESLPEARAELAAIDSRIEKLEKALRAVFREHREPYGAIPTPEEQALIEEFAKEFGIDA